MPTGTDRTSSFFGIGILNRMRVRIELFRGKTDNRPEVQDADQPYAGE